MSIKVYNPFQELRHLNHLNYTLDGFYKPTTDLFESKDEFIVKVNLPGFSKDQISIDATFDELEIKAIQKVTADEEQTEDNSTEVKNDETWTARHIERVTRNYRRKIKFNKPIDTQKSKVELENGVLTVILPISAEAKKVSLKIV